METREQIKKKKKRLKKRWKAVLYPFYVCCALLIGTVIFAFTTSTGHEFRKFLASTILSTQHRYLANYLGLSQAELKELINEINNPKFINSSKSQVASLTNSFSKNFNKHPLEIKIKSISEERPSYFFKGKLMEISNPLNVRLVTSQNPQGKDYGELLSKMAKRADAIGAINANGFYDPSGMGDGGIPLGIMIENGQTISKLNRADYTVGLTDKGVLITGKYTPQQLLDLGVKYAGGFKPQLIVHREKMITHGTGGGGINPRTAIGQKKDGTILFLVIDGRQPTHSIGATLKDVQDLLYNEGAINAMCMDGGASSSMYFNDSIINIPATPAHIGRFIPDAWVVTPNPNQKVKVYNDGELVDVNTTSSIVSNKP